MTDARQPLVERAERFPLKIPLRYLEGGLSEWHEGETVNISHTGILFEAHKSLPVNSELDLELQLAKKTTLSCHGSIVRTQKSLAAVHIETYNIFRS